MKPIYDIPYVNVHIYTYLGNPNLTKDFIEGLAELYRHRQKYFVLFSFENPSIFYHSWASRSHYPEPFRLVGYRSGIIFSGSNLQSRSGPNLFNNLFDTTNNRVYAYAVVGKVTVIKLLRYITSQEASYFYK
jgi:hypothetical protein